MIYGSKCHLGTLKSRLKPIYDIHDVIGAFFRKSIFPFQENNLYPIKVENTQSDEIIKARIEIDLSDGTKIIPLRDLLFLDFRVKSFFIIFFIYNSFTLLKEL